MWSSPRYLISLILLWTLMKQVDLLPPSMKDLQLGRFLKNGTGLFHFSWYIPLVREAMVECFRLYILLALQIESISHRFWDLKFRTYASGESHRSNAMCYVGSITGSKTGLNDDGCVSSLLADLAGNLVACWRLGCGWTSKSCVST